MLRFYRSTEGLICALSLLASICIALSFAWSLAAASALLSVPLAFLSLFVGGAGFFLWADAVQRLFDALHERFGDFINEVMSA